MRTLRNKIISLVLSLTILTNMVGCSNNKNDSQEETIVVASGNVDNKEDAKEPEVAPKLEENNLEGKLELVEIDITPFIDKLNEINPEYNYQEFYHSKESIEDILEVANTYSECPSEEVLNIEELVDCIIENSNAYENSPFIIKQDMDKDRYAYIGTALRRALNNLANELNEEDLCKLKNISIVDGILDEDVNGLYENDKMLITIDYEKIKSFYEMDNTNNVEDYDFDFIEYLSEIIQHELNHARQFICNHRAEFGQINESIKYNGLSTFIESSAESQLYSNDVNNNSNFVIYSDIDTLDYVYFRERCAQTYLFLMGMFKESFSIEKYYECIFNSDLKSLYEMYELETINDYKTFYNIIYALDTLNGRTDLVINILGDKSSISQGQLEQEVGSAYKIYIFREITKDLIARLNKKDITFDECMYLYNYVFVYILDNVSHLHFLADGSYLKDEEGIGMFIYEEIFINGINDIQNIFYDFVCKFYGVSLEDIKDFDQKRYDLSNILYYEELNNIKSFYGNEEEIANILNKFPIIREINFTNPAYTFEIDFYEEYVNGESRTRFTNVA